MDSQQTAALNALAPFVALSSSATSPRAAADLISQAISAPNTYVFTELLQTSNIQALRTAEQQYARWLRALEIFSWGTWAEYQADTTLPPLTDPQTSKLRLLTLLTLASHPDPGQTLTYPSLLSSLSLDTTPALEKLLTTAIYAGLISAKLNPLQQRVDVSSVAPVRDLAPGSVTNLIKILQNWEGQCVSVLREVEGRIYAVKDGAKERDFYESRWRDGLEEMVRGVNEKDAKMGGTYSGGWGGGGFGAGSKREGGDLEEDGRRSGAARIGGGRK